MEFLCVDGALLSHVYQYKKPTDKDKMLTFIALIIHAGTIKVNRY